MSGLGWVSIICVAGLGLVVVLARTFFYVVDVQGQSMTPALTNGDRVLVLRFCPARCLRRGQIVIATYRDTPWLQQQPNVARAQKYIKRITGLAGDVMLIDRPGLPRLLAGQSLDVTKRRLWHVPAGHCFVQGDSWGLDSTVVGPIPFRALGGIVVMKLRRPVARALRSAPHRVSRTSRLQ